MSIIETQKNSSIRDAYKIFAVIGILGFSALLANVLIIYKSIRTSDGLVEENYYSHGVNYQHVLDQKINQEKLGWQIKLSSTTPYSMKPIESKEKIKADSYLSKDYKEQHKISLIVKEKDIYTLSIFDKAGKSIKNADIKLNFFRPTQSGFDKDIVLAEKSPGIYSSETILPLDGIWDLYINVKKDGIKWNKRERIRVIK